MNRCSSADFVIPNKRCTERISTQRKTGSKFALHTALPPWKVYKALGIWAYIFSLYWKTWDKLAQFLTLTMRNILLEGYNVNSWLFSLKLTNKKTHFFKLHNIFFGYSRFWWIPKFFIWSVNTDFYFLYKTNWFFEVRKYKIYCYTHIYSIV